MSSEVIEIDCGDPGVLKIADQLILHIATKALSQNGIDLRLIGAACTAGGCGIVDEGWAHPRLLMQPAAQVEAVEFENFAGARLVA